MFVIYGWRSSGRVFTEADELISTSFFHVFLVPVLPLQSLRVAKKGFVLDEGEEIPFNKKSILAGYLRHLFFGVVCLGFAMAFDGLFLDSVVEKDKPSLIAVGTSALVAGFLLWLWAMFVLGSRIHTATFRESSRVRIAGGLLCLAAVLSLLFGTAHLLPRQPTLEDIAADRTISDEDAIGSLAAKVFPEHADVTTSRDGQDVELRVSYVSGKEPSVRTFEGQGKSDAAQIHKASAVTTMLLRVKDIVRHGRSRHLSKVRVSLATTVLGEDGQPCQVEAYRVTIPKEKFGNLVKTKTTKELLFSSDTVFEQLGVVDVDNFSKFDYQP